MPAIVARAARVATAALMRECQAMTTDGTLRPAIEIRRLHPGDWAALRAMRLAALAEAPYAFASTLEREGAFDEQEWRSRLATTVHFGAWDPAPDPRDPDPRLVGLAATFPERPAATERPEAPEQPAAPASPAVTWHLVAMWVSPEHRGQGIADRLVAAVCELARARGAGQVALWVADANPRARVVYRRLGFRPTGQRGILRPGEPELGEERMTRALS
ncbi:MAG: GNAT family N-acetyltransferase [Streptosporangiaceae bacterium]